jgi:hypothetical protein
MGFVWNVYVKRPILRAWMHARWNSVMAANALMIADIVVRLGRTVRSSILRFWTGLISERPDQYQPERHYMRGPGPKCREKRGELR